LSSWCRRCHAAAVQRWRDQNPEKAASYNLARRVKHEPRPCVRCGEPFVPRRSDTQLCSDLGRPVALGAPPQESGGVSESEAG
jgi:hypothetical protein